MLVLLIEPHPLYRRAIALLLKQTPDVRLLGAYSGPLEGISLEEDPELILIGQQTDQACPSTLDWARWLRKVWPSADLLILGVPNEREWIEGKQLGRVRWSSRQISNQQLVQTLQKAKPSFSVPQTESTRTFELTPTELSLWRELALGGAESQISSQLRLREATVQATQVNLMEKLDTFTTWGLRHLAKKFGITP